MTPEPSPSSVPRHVAIIMDGNGRWAQKNHLPRLEGHRRGTQAVREAIKAAVEVGVEYLTLYAFSVENWKRPAEETNGLMDLLGLTLRQQLKELQEQKIRLKAIGRLSDLPPKAIKELQHCMDETADNRRMTLILALSYGSRVEISEAVRQIALEVKRGALNPEKIDESLISEYLYTKDIPDPDLLIRTSGEHRLSNFLLWQMSYTEIYVTQTLWPDFKKADLIKAVEDYQKRQRRFGGI